MGCLSFFLEFAVLYIVEFWFGLMQLIIPEKLQGNLRKVIKIFVYILSFILFALIFISIFGMIFGDEYTQIVSKKIFFVSFGISVMQIGLGMIVRSINKKK